MTEQKKRQHYVPQFYLNNFGVPKKNFFTIKSYDKVLGKDFSNGIREIAQTKKFYNVTAQNYEENLGIKPPSNFDEQELEDTFSTLEGEWSTLFRVISERYEESKIQKQFPAPFISTAEKETLSNFIALQAIRTPAFRDRANSLSRFLEKNLDDELSSLFEDRDYDEIHFYLHIHSGVMDRLAKHLLDNFNWICAFSERPLITTDNPLAQIFHLQNQSQYNGQDWPKPPYFEEYSIALTPNILLLLVPKDNKGFELLLPTADFLLTHRLHLRYTRYHIINSSRRIFYHDNTELQYIKGIMYRMSQRKENFLDSSTFIVSAP